MERKIGEIFEYNGEWYQCVTGRYCGDCAFRNDDCEERERITLKEKLTKEETTGLCVSELRSDCKSVIFKKLEKVGEPYMLEDKKFQKYRVFHTPYIYHKIDYSWQSFADPYYVSLEIKQKEEDMEEKKQCGDNRFRTIARAKEHLFQATNIAEDKKELEVLDSFLLRCWQMGWLKQYEDIDESKSNLKPFDLEAAKAGKPVCTKDGRKARIIAFDRNDLYPIVALIECGDGKEIIGAYSKEGQTDIYEIKGTDLMMLPEKKEGWININKDAGLFKSKEEAERDCTKDYVPVRVEFEI